MARALNKTFFQWLQTDPLNLLDIISKYDCLAIHFSEGKSLKIYFKGFLILTISDKIMYDKDIHFNVLSPSYIGNEDGSCITRTINGGVCIANLQEYLDLIIGFLSRRNNTRVEEALRQEISRVNNRSSVANSTDYFIVDEEYKINGPKFDLVTIKWISDGNIRKSFKYDTPSLEIVIFELKQGLNAIGGGEESTSEKSDLKKHYSDFQALISDNASLSEFKSDIVKMFVQQASLKGFFNSEKIKGLKNVRALSNPWNEEAIQAIAQNIPVKFGIIISDYKQQSSSLINQIKLIPDNFLFATSSFMGYGLYQGSMLDRDQLLKILRNEDYHPSRY